MIMHKELTAEKWFQLSLLEQLANVGMDISRTIKWKNRGEMDHSQSAFFRALELLDFTIADPKNRKRLRELVRARYVLVDHFFHDNEYNSTDEQWENYFYDFSYAAALEKGR